MSLTESAVFQATPFRRRGFCPLALIGLGLVQMYTLPATLQ
jgi:hypothetical protein